MEYHEVYLEDLNAIYSQMEQIGGYMDDIKKLRELTDESLAGIIYQNYRKGLHYKTYESDVLGR